MRVRAHRSVLALVATVGSVAAVGTSVADAATHAKASNLKVAVLEPGSKNDGSWGQAVDSGALAAGKSVGVSVSLDDNLETPAQYQQAGAAYASKGYKLVIVANGSDPQTVVALAKQFPKVWFCEEAATIKPLPKNVCTTNITYYDGDFLAGALAAMVSKTGTLGEIGGFSFPQLNWEMNGFSLGARYVDPKVKIVSTYVNTWTDVSTTGSAAKAQIAAGADVIFSATDQATEGIYAAAAQKGHTYAIAQYFDTHSQAPSVVLTSVLFNLQGATGNLIRYLAHGTLKSRNYEVGYNQGAGRLAPFYGLAPSVVTPAIQKRLGKIEALIARGKLVVPALPNQNQGKTYSLAKFPKAPAA